jgi:hypothetical protein
MEGMDDWDDGGKTGWDDGGVGNGAGGGGTNGDPLADGGADWERPDAVQERTGIGFSIRDDAGTNPVLRAWCPIVLVEAEVVVGTTVPLASSASLKESQVSLHSQGGMVLLTGLIIDARQFDMSRVSVRLLDSTGERRHCSQVDSFGMNIAFLKI